MNPKTQYHIGTILKALGDLGQHLMGADPETVAPTPAITGEPTTDKPKAGRPRNPVKPTAEPAAAPAQAVSAPAETVAVQAPTAAIATEDDFGAAPASVTHKDPFASYEEARAFIDPFVKNHPGEVTKIIAGMLPEGKTGLRALIEFPEKHPEFIKQILALK